MEGEERGGKANIMGRLMSSSCQVSYYSLNWLYEPFGVGFSIQVVVTNSKREALSIQLVVTILKQEVPLMRLVVTITVERPFRSNWPL